MKYIDTSGMIPRFVVLPIEKGANELDNKVKEQEKKTVDITEKLTSFMRANAKTLSEYYEKHGFIQAAIYFYQNVTDNGVLDIKMQKDWAFEEGTEYTFNGMVLRNDDPGNINFGYVGAVLFTEEVLCAGAGANQISKYGFKYGDISTYFDDPRDNKMIKYGFGLYMEDQKNETVK